MIRFKLEKKSHFWLEMLKTSLLGKCLIYFNQIFSDFEGKYFLQFLDRTRKFPTIV